MPFLGEKDPDKEAQKAAQRKQQAASRAAAEHHARAHVNALPKWEYQVKRIAEHRQKGLLGSREMERTLNQAGAEGWELIGIEEERATFKRQLPPPLTPPASVEPEEPTLTASISDTVCPSCGQPHEPSASFCTHCGAQLAPSRS